MPVVQELFKTNTDFISNEQLLLLADKVVLKYVYAGSIPQKEKDDIKMAIIEKFLIKRNSIKEAYRGSSKISTYCIAILNRMCCEEIRKGIKTWEMHRSEYANDKSTRHNFTIEKLLINDEIKLLDRIIQLFDLEQFKVRLFIAYFHQLSLIEKDLACYDEKYKTKKLDLLFRQIDLKNKGDIFKNLATAVKKAEDKNIKHDAVRMWLNNASEKIIARLNGSFKRANYNKESMQILFEYYHNQRITK